MKKWLTLFGFVAFAVPMVVFADTVAIEGGGVLETAIRIAYLLSTAGFLIATVMMGFAVRQFGESTFGEIFSYFVIGTATFLVITIFQQLGPGFFFISDESMDVWWHLMFYIAMISYYKGLKSLVALGENSGGVQFSASVRSYTAFMWGGKVLLALAVIFIIPYPAESLALFYLGSPLGDFGFHHFVAFALAGMVGWYLFKAKKTLGAIGNAIATPMLVTIWALSLQHLWELQFESWKTVHVSTQVGEGGEKIFLTIAGLGVAYAAWRLAHFQKKTPRTEVNSLETPLTSVLKDSQS